MEENTCQLRDVIFLALLESEENPSWKRAATSSFLAKFANVAKFQC